MEDATIKGDNSPTINGDVDYYYKIKPIPEEDLFKNLPDDEEFDKIVQEMMCGGENLFSQVETKNDETMFYLNRIIVPEELLRDSSYTGPLYGFFRKETGCHVILGWEKHMIPKEIGTVCIGYIENENSDSKQKQDTIIDIAYKDYCILGKRDHNNISFYIGKYDKIKGQYLVTNNKLIIDRYSLIKKLFSRNSGLLETDWMSNCSVIISGCGSVGSLLAIHLAKSGVGKFVLIDDDILEISNVSRHLCSLRDIGRRKVDAVREQILCVNPYAEVVCFWKKVQDVPWADIDPNWLQQEKAVIIGACDNRVGNAIACDVAYEYGIPFASLGFNERAWGGEIFTCLPEKHDVCYRCVFKKQIDDNILHYRVNHDYIDSQHSDLAYYEPGLVIDIEFGVSIFNKIVLDIANRNNSKYASRIYHTLTQYTLFSGTDNQPKGFWKTLFKEPISIKSVVIKEGSRRCKHCLKKQSDDRK